MVDKINRYFFGEDFDIAEAHWTDQAVYFGLPAIPVAVGLLHLFL